MWTFTLLVRSFRDDVLTFLSRDETVPADGESTPVFSRRTPKGARTSRVETVKAPAKRANQIHVARKPNRSKNGTNVPVAAIPRPKSDKYQAARHTFSVGRNMRKKRRRNKNDRGARGDS